MAKIVIKPLLQITLVGKSSWGFQNIRETVFVPVSGTPLSIRRAESAAVKNFMQAHKLGSCGVKSGIVKQTDSLELRPGKGL